jgi:peptidoglycan/xylan/chitin deacetylase (PgdA/CDA1 family)
MKVVMYHYVRPFDESMPYFKALNIEDFKKQLDFFEEKYGFVSKKDFIESLNSKKACNGVILTFDDGFKDHYEFVFPELVKRGLWGIFYIPTKPLSTEKLLDVHSTHVLLGKFGGRVIYNSLKEIINKGVLSHKHINEFNSLTYSKQDNDNQTKMVKRILNYFIDYKYRGDVVTKLMKIYFPNSLKLHRNFYMTKDEINKMYKSGMIIGSHSVTHPVMSKLKFKDQQKEILNSFDELSFAIDNKLKTFCYPYGGFHTFTNETLQILKKSNCSFAFNVESRDVDDYDLSVSLYTLPRYDCNEFPYGSYRK